MELLQSFIAELKDFLRGPMASITPLPLPEDLPIWLSKWPNPTFSLWFLQRKCVDPLEVEALKNEGFPILEEIDSLRIERLDHYKCTAQWKHEFVVATAVQRIVNQEPKTIRFFWERNNPLPPDADQKSISQFSRKPAILAGRELAAMDDVNMISADDMKKKIEGRAHAAKILRSVTPSMSLLPSTPG